LFATAGILQRFYSQEFCFPISAFADAFHRLWNNTHPLAFAGPAGPQFATEVFT
jgi:hypothetical protein